MVLILLEALAALALLLLIVWWTMFSGRDKGELRGPHSGAPPSARTPEHTAAQPDGAARDGSQSP